MYMILTPTQTTWEDFSTYVAWLGYELLHLLQLWYNYKLSTAIINSSKMSYKTFLKQKETNK